MSVINALDLSIAFGENTILDQVTFEINENEKVGLVGANGVGKTTLFKIITGQYSHYTGIFTKGKTTKIGYMEQHTCSEKGRTVYDELVSVFSDLIEMEQEIERCSDHIEHENGDIHVHIKRLDELTERFQSQGGLTYQSRTRATLIGLGFSEMDFEMKTNQLSGGQRSKLTLAKLLLSDANFLLLDEPTNHLDIPSVEWLESFLNDFKGSVFIISHDRYFLDKVTNKTMELHNCKMMCYKGNYSTFVEKKKRIQKSIAEKYQEDLKEIHRLEGIVAQQRQWNREKNIKTAESKLKQIDRIKAQMVVPDNAVEKIHFDFSPKAVSGNEVLLCEGLAKSFGPHTLFKNADFLIKRKERIFLLGPNGCGKTTLLKILMGDLERDKGNIFFGANVQTGYFDQVQEKLHLDKSAIDEVWDQFPYMTQTEIRNALAAFLFRGDEVFQKIETLSGGERARIALLKLMLGRFNFLLLDEPTNHLDAFSRDELENTLLEYEGTLLIVSHDRYFINKLAHRIFYMTEDGITSYTGNYDSFAEKHKHLLEQPAVQKADKRTGVNDYKEKKEWQSNLRKLKTAVSKIEAEIAALETAVTQGEALLSQENVTSDYELLLAETAKLDENNRILEEKMNAWEKMTIDLQELLQKY